MGLEAKSAELRNIEETVFIAAGATLTALQRVVRIDSTAGAIALKLPRVVEAYDKIYSLKLTAGANIVTVTSQGDSETAFSDNHMNAAGEFLVVYSDGRQWYILATG